jgi:hypothetical protein
MSPENVEDALWAAEQVLKSGACGAALLWLQGTKNAYAWLRRLQMAAESGRAMAVHFRGIADESLSTPAHLRVALTREAGILRARIPKRRGPPLAARIAIESNVVALNPPRASSPARIPLIPAFA